MPPSKSHPLPPLQEGQPVSMAAIVAWLKSLGFKEMPPLQNRSDQKVTPTRNSQERSQKNPASLQSAVGYCGSGSNLVNQLRCHPLPGGNLTRSNRYHCHSR